MRIAPENLTTAVPKEEQVLHRVALDITRVLKDLAWVINGRLGFGDGVSRDNIVGEWISFTSSATPGAENTIAHNLGVVPCGFILMMPPQSGTVNKGTTAWTTSNIYLTCSAASQSVTIFLLPATSE